MLCIFAMLNKLKINSVIPDRNHPQNSKRLFTVLKHVPSTINSRKLADNFLSNLAQKPTNRQINKQTKQPKLIVGLDWIEQGLTSPPTQYRLSRRQFYRSKDPTNSIKVLKEKLASHSPEEAQNPPGASHRVTSEPLKKEKPYHSGSSPARQSPTQQANCRK